MRNVVLILVVLTFIPACRREDPPDGLGSGASMTETMTEPRETPWGTQDTAVTAIPTITDTAATDTTGTGGAPPTAVTTATGTAATTTT